MRASQAATDASESLRASALLLTTAIYTVAFSTAKSEAVHYAYRQFPGQPGRAFLENHHPNPPTGCMGTDPDPDPDATHNKAVRFYDCLGQLAPPLALVKMAAIAATDGLRRNVPQTVAHLTGGEYFKLTTAKSLETSLAAIANHVPNRYTLSFQPRSPHPGLIPLSSLSPAIPTPTSQPARPIGSILSERLSGQNDSPAKSACEK